MRLSANAGSMKWGHTQWVASFIVVGTYLVTRLPVETIKERSDLASRFRFVKEEIPESPFDNMELLNARQVHPSLTRINAWISATGAGATIADLDGDGLENDLLLTDPRLNKVIVCPVPHSGDRFTSFTLDAGGLDFDPNTMSPTGTLVGDFNEDGLCDLLVYYWGRTPVLFLRRAPNPPGQKEELRNSFEAMDLVAPDGSPKKWYTHAATQADVDGDGHLDLIFGNFFQDGADILNRYGAGVESVMQDGKSKAFNGGGPKLFVWEAASAGANPIVSYRNRSDTLTDQMGNSWVLAVGAADLDSDGLPEIYFANDFGPDRLLYNRSIPGSPRFLSCEGTRNFTTPKSFALGHDSFKGMGVDFSDVNGDGIFDIYVSNIADEWALQESHFLWVSTGRLNDFRSGIAPYSQDSEEYGLSRSGWGWDCRLADFDNDGTPEAIQATGFIKGTINRWPELQALGTTNDRMIHDPRFWPRLQIPSADISGNNRNPFFVRSASGRYVNIAAELGIDDSLNTRGIAIADVDGDGLLDFVEANQWNPSYFYRNESASRMAYLGLHLLLPVNSGSSVVTVHDGHPSSQVVGRPAIGAVAQVRLHDGRTLVRQVDGGSGHAGRGSQSVHFGLGDASYGPWNVSIRWRAVDGALRSTTIDVETGWHTVVLGSNQRS